MPNGNKNLIIFIFLTVIAILIIIWIYLIVSNPKSDIYNQRDIQQYDDENSDIDELVDNDAIGIDAVEDNNIRQDQIENQIEDILDLSDLENPEINSSNVLDVVNNPSNSLLPPSKFQSVN